MMQVPFLDLSRSLKPLQADLLASWERALHKTSFIGGRAVADFEQAFADYCGVKGCVGVANGTDALILCLKALGIGPGDQVVVPALTFFATAEAVKWIGAEPIFVDVDTSAGLDAHALQVIASADEGRIKAVIAVHLYGIPVNLEAIEQTCKEQGWALIEDAAQAQGATYKGQKIGSFGDAAAFSFYPTKNLGAAGDAGAVTSQRSDVLEEVRRLSNHGRVGHAEHACIGTNSRLDALQAQVLSLKLPHLEIWNQERRHIQQRYREMLSGTDEITFLNAREHGLEVVHQCMIQAPNRDLIRQAAASQGVQTAVYYPRALCDEPTLSHKRVVQSETSTNTAFTNARAIAAQNIALPCYPGLRDDEVDYVCQVLKDVLSNTAGVGR